MQMQFKLSQCSVGNKIRSNKLSEKCLSGV